jgi:2-iminobutanoate/2-iminopropanoate deaminase
MTNTNFLILLVMLSLLSCKPERAQHLEKEKWHFDSESKQDDNIGYSQALRMGAMVYISGTVTDRLDSVGIAQLYQTGANSLAAMGLTFADVIKENLYTTDIEAMKGLNHVRKIFYQNDYPAATWAQVQQLFLPEFKVEVEWIAWDKSRDER